MKNLILAVSTLLLLTACKVQQPNFSKMSEQELHQYNSSVKILDRVYCKDEVRIGSHIRSRYCTTYGHTLGGDTGILNTPSSSTSTTYAR
jgi:starvation-inducible outer membrane lipoprotein